MYIHFTTALKYIRLEMQGEIDGSTIIVGDFNMPLLVSDRSSRQKISEIVVNQLELTSKDYII